MNVSAKDKRLKALNRGERGVKGLQPNEETIIVMVIAALQAAANLAVVSTAHPSWRVHHHKPRKPTSYWSVDVTGNTRLLFIYDTANHVITGMVYDDPHP